MDWNVLFFPLAIDLVIAKSPLQILHLSGLSLSEQLCSGKPKGNPPSIQWGKPLSLCLPGNIPCSGPAPYFPWPVRVREYPQPTFVRVSDTLPTAEGGSWSSLTGLPGLREGVQCRRNGGVCHPQRSPKEVSVFGVCQ